MFHHHRQALLIPSSFAEQGSLSRELEKAGFYQIEEEFRAVTWNWPGSPEEFWQHLREVSAPFHPIIDSLPADQQQQAISEGVEAFRRYYDGQRVNAPALIVVASGAR